MMADSTSVPSKLVLVLVFSTSLCLIVGPQCCHGAARLIHVPLQRATTQGAGELGQPILNYYSLINVGTPPIAFKIQFDVGLNELFLPHYSWNPFNRNLHYSAGFQCKSSSSCHKTDTQFSFLYQQVQLTGKRYADTMTLAMARSNSTAFEGGQPLEQQQQQQQPLAASNNASVTAAPLISPAWRQNFVAVSSASDGRFSSLPIDGFFGLGPLPQSSSGVDNLLVSLHNAKLLDNLQFSLWLNPVLDSPNGGELILGGVDTNKYQGQIYWHHLTGVAASQWTLNLQYVSLGNQVIGQQPSLAVLSTGHSDIVGPREEVRNIYNLLNTTRSSNGLELIDCRRIASLPHLSFFIDGIPYYLLPSNYIRKTTDGRLFKKETCYVAILAAAEDAPRLWTLATPFLGAYYSIYDLTYRQIGFAALK